MTIPSLSLLFKNIQNQKIQEEKMNIWDVMFFAICYNQSVLWTQQLSTLVYIKNTWVGRVLERDDGRSFWSIKPLFRWFFVQQCLRITT